MHTQPTSGAALSDRATRVGVVGLSRDGLDLARRFAAAGFPTLGYDADVGYGDHLLGRDAGSSEGPELAADLEELRELDAVIVCVPVPVTPAGGPDWQCLVAVAGEIARRPRPGRLIVLTTPVPPGTIRSAVFPALTAGGSVPGRDFLLAHSPDPDSASSGPLRVVGGVDRDSVEAATALFGTIHPAITRVSSLEAAEACGLAGAALRAVRAAAEEEFSRMCDGMGLDRGEIFAATGLAGPPRVSDRAEFDFASLLAWSARRYRASARFLDLATEVHAAGAAFVVGKVVDALNARGKPVKGSRIAVPGVLPPDSLASEVTVSLRVKGALVTVDAPLTPEFLAVHDAVLLLTPLPAAGDIDALVTHSPLVIDGCGATRGVAVGRGNVIRA